jgi:hypothetical protein
LIINDHDDAEYVPTHALQIQPRVNHKAATGYNDRPLPVDLAMLINDPDELQSFQVLEIFDIIWLQQITRAQCKVARTVYK